MFRCSLTRLHSSKLDYLGLTSAANSFCKELSYQQKVEIDFSHTGSRVTFPGESRFVYSVLQEALQNGVKLSGVPFRSGAAGDIGRDLLTVNQFSINSQPVHGTTIYARVPLRTDEQRASVAG